MLDRHGTAWVSNEERYAILGTTYWLWDTKNGAATIRAACNRNCAASSQFGGTAIFNRCDLPGSRTMWAVTEEYAASIGYRPGPTKLAAPMPTKTNPQSNPFEGILEDPVYTSAQRRRLARRAR